MGLLEDFSAWLDQGKRRTAHFAQNPGLLWTQLNEDARAYRAEDKRLFDEERSVMPGVREPARQASTNRAMELGGLLGSISKLKPTKFQLAHAEAQRNAALPVEQGGLGLGPQNTAMERAKAMGFDTDVYHGTKGDKNWSGIDAFDLSMAEPGLTGKGVYTTSSPAIAGGGKGNNVAPQGYATNEALNHVFAKEQELLTEIEQVKKTLAQAKASGDVEKQKLFSDWLAGNEKELADLGQWKTGGGAVYPLTVRAGKSFDPERMKLKRSELPRDVVVKIEDGLLAQGKNPKGKWPLSYSMLDNATGGVDAANDVLRSLGYGSLQYKGGKITGVPVNHQVTMAFDPSQVRSRFAAFDPKKKDSRDLLASMGLLGLLGAGAYGQEQ